MTPFGGGGCEQAPGDIVDDADGIGAFEPCVEGVAGAGTKGVELIRACEEVVKFAGEVGRVFGAEQVAADVGADEIGGGAADVAGEDRSADGCGFGDDDAVGFVTGGEEEKVGVGHEGEVVGGLLEAEEVEGLVEVVAGEGLEGGFFGADTGDEVMVVGQGGGTGAEGVEGEVEAFFMNEAGGGEEVARVWRKVVLGKDIGAPGLGGGAGAGVVGVVGAEDDLVAGGAVVAPVGDAAGVGGEEAVGVADVFAEENPFEAAFEAALEGAAALGAEVGVAEHGDGDAATGAGSDEFAVGSEAIARDDGDVEIEGEELALGVGMVALGHGGATGDAGAGGEDEGAGELGGVVLVPAGAGVGEGGDVVDGGSGVGAETGEVVHHAVEVMFGLGVQPEDAAGAGGFGTDLHRQRTLPRVSSQQNPRTLPNPPKDLLP